MKELDIDFPRRKGRKRKVIIKSWAFVSERKGRKA